jgi:hypothetical protein
VRAASLRSQSGDKAGFKGLDKEKLIITVFDFGHPPGLHNFDKKTKIITTNIYY